MVIPMKNIADMQSKFKFIYEAHLWTTGSGTGSLLCNNMPYINFLENFIYENNIQTVLDFGCGDWQFSQSIRWGDIKYYGYDIVPRVIQVNQEKYGCGKYSFHLFDGDLDSLPKTDLLICKDVLQHWSNANIQEFLAILPDYSYSLLTNCTEIVDNHEAMKGGDYLQNEDIPNGDFRKLDLQKSPFFVNGEVVFSYTNNTNFSNHQIEFFKKTVLVRGRTKT